MLCGLHIRLKDSYFDKDYKFCNYMLSDGFVDKSDLCLTFGGQHDFCNFVIFIRHVPLSRDPMQICPKYHRKIAITIRCDSLPITQPRKSYFNPNGLPLAFFLFLTKISELHRPYDCLQHGHSMFSVPKILAGITCTQAMS